MNGTIFVTMMALFIPTPLLFAREAQTAAPEKMKAIVLHEYGGPAVLHYEGAPRPEPKDDEVLIRVIAASVNPVDVAIRIQPSAMLAHLALFADVRSGKNLTRRAGARSLRRRSEHSRFAGKLLLNLVLVRRPSRATFEQFGHSNCIILRFVQFPVLYVAMVDIRPTFWV